MTGHLWFDILLIILVPGLLLIAAFWFVALGYLRRNLRAMPVVAEGYLESLAPAGEGNHQPPLITIIIPAHNEEDRIGPTLESIRTTDYAHLEIIVVADRCTDRTQEIVAQHAAEDARVRLIDKQTSDPDWSGKCHACWTGYQHAKGDWFIFTDADTKFDSRLVRSAVGLAVRDGYDGVSMYGHLGSDQVFEKVAQPVACFVLMGMYPPSKANRADAEKRRPIMNGQFILVSRKAYEDMGTHEAVRNVMLEDIRISRHLTRLGYRIALASAGPMLKVSMYPTIEAFRSGWIRILIEISNHNIHRLHKRIWRLRGLALLSVVPFFSIVLTCALLGYGSTPPVAAAAIGAAAALAQAMQLIFLAKFYRLAGGPAHYAVTFPVGCWMFASVVRDAVKTLREGRSIRWGNRDYQLNPREGKSRKNRAVA